MILQYLESKKQTKTTQTRKSHRYREQTVVRQVGAWGMIEKGKGIKKHKMAVTIFLVLSCMSFLHILDISPLWDMSCVLYGVQQK